MKVDRLDNVERSTERSGFSAAEILARQVRKMVDAELENGEGRRAPLYQAVIAAAEKPLIESVLQHCGGNQSHAALALGINRNTLRKMMRVHGVKATP